MFRFAMLAGVLLIVPPQLKAADDITDETKKLEGTWNVVSVEAEGELRLPKDFGDGLPKKLKILANKIDSLLIGESQTYSIDPKQNPRHLDMRSGDGKDTEMIKWIYSLDDDELRLAVTFDLKLFGGESDKSRPKSFNTKGNKVIVINLKREKK
jgi:uncharacterized protein (TIGR03067 family)